MKFLFVTEPDDRDAISVKLALEAKGHHVRLLFTADQPSCQKNSIYLGNHFYRWKSSDMDQVCTENDYDVVWWRRPRKPYLPNTLVHPEDHRFVLRENHAFFESLTDNLAPNAWWVNAKAPAIRANSKLYQLKVASSCGLSTPITLCSNDPEDIQEFIAHYEGDGVIYKPLHANFWFEGDRTIKASYTAKVDRKSLASQKILQATPGIYQKLIPKYFELRITCFGDYLVAAQIHSQQEDSGKMDWRAIPGKNLQLSPFQLPAEFEVKIRNFLYKMGLVFGAIDVIVTPEGEFVFLEVNEQGQFLWVEEYIADYKMLDMFVNFLQNKSREFHWDRHHVTCDISANREAMFSIVDENIRKHVWLNSAAMQRQLAY